MVMVQWNNDNWICFKKASIYKARPLALLIYNRPYGIMIDNHPPMMPDMLQERYQLESLNEELSWLLVLKGMSLNAMNYNCIWKETDS